MNISKAEFLSYLETNDIKVTFIKKSDKSERTLYCSSQIPPEKIPQQNDDNANLVIVYVPGEDGYKSFYMDSIVDLSLLPMGYAFMTNN